MQYVNKFFAFIFSRQMLAFVAIVLLALAVWFVGPLLAFDGLRPLASAGVRISLIVLMLVTGILWLVSGPLSMVAVAALCLLVWQAGPLVALGASHPLAPAWVRAVIIAAVLLAYAVYWLFRFWRALRNNEDLLTKFLNFGKADPKDNAAREELKTVSATVARAVSQLRSLRLRGGGLRRVFEGNRYLYELPWYMVVGSAGAGKTTALLNSGLQFPVARQMGNAPRSTVMQSQGGTLNCDWWFTNDAVLIDTAGRYATHETDAERDPAEWHGFLALLRKYRTRAPINGAIVALNAAELLTLSDIERAEQASLLRDRLAELRKELGIRFPVYVIVTKMDLLRGFSEYFQSLTSEGRTQVWGFTLPHDDAQRGKAGSGDRDALREQVAAELALLKDRLAAGLRSRLNEEFDAERRRRMFALPQELAGLAVPLTDMIDQIFLDSRFDGTQSHNMLRGVYLTSGGQSESDVPSDPLTLSQRLWRTLGLSPFASVRRLGSPSGELATAQDARAARLNTLPTRGQQGYFLQDVLSKVVIPEAHLVRPNLGWEWRLRMLRWLGHALAVVIFLWLAGALALSFSNNRQYLRTVDARAQNLLGEVRGLFADFKATDVPEVLNGARELPGYAGLDLASPSTSFLYGLYSAPPVLEASRQTYAQLQNHTLLPYILQRMETVLAQSVQQRDAKTAYETLRVYKLLHDKERYMKDGGARDVRNWVLKDWEQNDSAAMFGGRASMVGHVQSLFSGARPVQAASLPNEALVRDAQSFLNSNTSTQRVYERAKAAMLAQAPQEFTLVRAVGPQAGTVFSRAGGLPLEKGVPGLFTYDGYHDVFDKRLPEFVREALLDDAWVMGSSSPSVKLASDGVAVDSAEKARNNALLEDIRRQYLNEYAQNWDAFLNSIRTVGSSDGAATTNTSLGFDLTVLRQFAAPDSPLARLARAAARETTLSRPLGTRAPEEKSFLDKASDELNKQTRDIGKNFGIRPEERLEKQLVDDRFAALREVVTGQPDAGGATGASTGGGKPGLEAISGLINEYYTLLVVADTALTSGSLPPGGAEVGARMKMEAGKLPAPFREVLTALAASGADKVNQGATEILRKQAQLQLDRIVGLMAAQVSEPCKRGLEGRYPFAAVSQDASIDDFTQVFANGGSADEFFKKYLAPFVDTSVQPWRYKLPDMANAMVGAENIGLGTPPAAAVNGPTLLGELLKLLAQAGPNLDTFQRAQQIRELFFRDAGGKKFAWKLEMKVMDLDPTITDLVIDIDGQGQRYMHGPVQSLAVNWPGPQGGTNAELTANPRVSVASSTLSTHGPWAVFRLLDKGRIVSTATQGRTSVEFNFDGRKALLDISAGAQANPLNSDVFKGFRCPGRIA